MTDKEVLEKAIGIALANGWDILEAYEAPEWWVEMLSTGKVDEPTLTMLLGKKDHYVCFTMNPRMVLLDQEFAKALWGEDTSIPEIKGKPLVHIQGNGLSILPAWKRHLQAMVIAPNPLEYLKEHIPDESV